MPEYGRGRAKNRERWLVRNRCLAGGIKMPYANYTGAEVVSRGEAIYAQSIRHQVEPTLRGKFLVMDIESGDYEVDEEDLQASERLLARRPQAVVYGLRIGHPAAFRIGGSFSLDEP
jgi:hypothetical protein